MPREENPELVLKYGKRVEPIYRGNYHNVQATLRLAGKNEELWLYCIPYNMRITGYPSNDKPYVIPLRDETDVRTFLVGTQIELWERQLYVVKLNYLK